MPARESPGRGCFPGEGFDAFRRFSKRTAFCARQHSDAKMALNRDAGFEPKRQRGARGHPGLGAFAKEVQSPRAVSPHAVSPRAVSPRAVSPHAVSPCAVSPRCKQGPPTLTLLSPLCLRRSLRTQQPPLSVVAYPRPSPSSPPGHQALSDLQAQRDVAAQPLPQLQHGESPSPGAGGHRPPDPSSPSAVPLLHVTSPRMPPDNF